MFFFFIKFYNVSLYQLVFDSAISKLKKKNFSQFFVNLALSNIFILSKNKFSCRFAEEIIRLFKKKLIKICIESYANNIN